ncbi:MAG: DUF1398 domain-containing protein, partial [Hyphomicrobiales bacterium]
MTANWKTIARTCLEGAESGAMTFPQIVGALMNAGFDGYSVDLRTATATYYLQNGDAVTLDAAKTSVSVAERFDSEAVLAA